MYEVRATEDAESRIYQDGRDWTASIRFPVSDNEEAYDRFAEAASVIKEITGDDLGLSVAAFDDALQDGSVREQGDDTTLRYNAEDKINVPPGKLRRALEQAPDVVVPSGLVGALGGSAGGLFGMIGGILGEVALGLPPGTLVFPATTGGGAAGGLVGAGAAFRGWKDNHDPPYSEEAIRRRKYVDADRPDGSLLDAVNEKRLLDNYLESAASSYRTEDVERRRDLREQDPEADLEAFMEMAFETLPYRDGVVATRTCDTYEEAAAFTADLLGADSVPEQPSIYADPEVFRHIMSFYTYESEERTDVIGSGRSILRRVFERDDVDPVIVDWLEETYPEQVEDIGRERALWSDGQG